MDVAFAGRRAELTLAQYDFLLAGGLLSEPALRVAAMQARQCGVPLHRLLVGQGLVEPAAYAAALANSLDLAFLPAPAELGLIASDGPTGLREGWASGTIEGNSWVALDGTIGSPRAVETIVRRLAARGCAVGLASPVAMRDSVLAGLGPAILRQAVSGLARSHPTSSARAGSWLWQSVALAAGTGALIGLTLIAGVSAQWLQTVLLTLPFLMVVALRLTVLLAYPFARPRPAPLSPVRDDRDLPVFTLLVPLYHEARVLPDLIAALRGLDYPAAKLDIKLILESVDAETLAAVRELGLRPPFELVVVPNRRPRGKPKALNYALAFARGEYVCVYDAEDVPEPDQLRRVATAFADGPASLGCVQGQLVIDNPGAGWLCSQFALEYLTLFDGTLSALDHLRLPLPLGGTSNHFPLRLLRHIGGWDAWNVTEDADLGFRLARRGYQAHVVATTTYEEAPHRFGNWLRQRTRWQKGWMQTYIVHSRQPLRHLADLGPWGWFGFHAQFGGVIVSSLIYPFSLALVGWQLFAGAPLPHAESYSDRLLMLVAVFNLLAGLGVALAHAAVCAIGRRRWLLLAAVPLMPVYWLLISLAAYRALWQLARQPFKWEKTEHGLSRRGV